MIKAIMGLKGSGKTKALADQANRAADVGKGDVVYIEKGTTLMYDVSHQVRLVNIEDYAIRPVSYTHLVFAASLLSKIW